MAERGFEALEAKLKDTAIDTKTKCNILIELREGIEQFCQSATYADFIHKIVPVLLDLLKDPPVFVSSSVEHRLRNTVLDILYRLPSNATEATERFAPQLVDRCIELVRIENEENAILCLKIVMDLERFHVKLLADRVEPFLDLIVDIFDGMEQMVKDTFDEPNQATTAGAPPTAAAAVAASNMPSTPANQQSPHPGSPVVLTGSFMTDSTSESQQNRLLPRGIHSFKLIAECPIIIVSIFQAYRPLVPKLIKPVIPRIRAVLMLEAGPQQRAHQEANARGATYCVITKEIAINPQKRLAFGELIIAQIKTLSFLAYLLRIYNGSVEEFVPILPDFVVRLLQDCPKDKPAARKELLVAIRHIMNFRFRNIFLSRLDTLLDERTLLGDALTVHEQSTSLAYTTLADLIHHMRESLTRDQIHKTVVVYSQNLRDDACAGSFATMSAKLLSNLAEPMANLTDKRDARYLIMMVLNATADKLKSLNRCYHNNVKLTAAAATEASVAIEPENFMPEKHRPPAWDEIDIFQAGPIVSLASTVHVNRVLESKMGFKNLVAGLKTIFYQLRATNPRSVKEEMDPSIVPPNWAEVAYGFSPEEVEVLIKLFHEGAQVFRYYTPDKVPEDSQGTTPVELLANQHMMTSGKEEKDLLEAFAGIFHHIDPSTFYEVFQTEIPHLYNMIYDHAALLHIPQFLLASEATSPAFCGLLLQFLMGKLGEVGTADVQKSSVILRLFKLSFMAVTLFSQQNEPVLLPHVTTLITKSIELSVTADEPMNYFLLLRSLFRSIGGGRFERLYKEILPLLEMLLEVLNNLLVSARKPHERDLFVELSLTVPARLSHLLPHLSYLMRPLVVALRAGSELIAQGLRTLELCVDNLTADYLDPIMAPVIDDLMSALWDHLKPQPYSHFHSHTTLRILGKLGGRNRKFINYPPTLQYNSYADDEASFDIQLTGSHRDRAFPSRIGCDTAIARLKETPKQALAQRHDAFHKQQALNLIKAQTKLLLGTDHLPADAAHIARLQASDLWDKAYTNGPECSTASDRAKSSAKLEAQRQMLLKLLKALMFAASVPDISEDASTFLAGVYRHFTLLEVGRALMHERRKIRPFEFVSGDGPMYIDSKVMSDAIADTLASDDALVCEQGTKAIKAMWQSASIIFGSAAKAESLPFFTVLVKRFVHCCYEEDWFTKLGGVVGIIIMLNDLEVSSDWLRSSQLDLVGALLFVIKDVPQDLPATVRIKASDALQIVVRKCNKDQDPADLADTTTPLHRVTSKLIMDLSHMSRHVRKATQDAFKSLAEVLGLELSDLVKGVKELVLMTLFNKPLRALPFAVSIGYIDALTFFLDMEDGVLEFDERLKKALLETLALVEADDDALTPKPFVYRSAESIINLRVACLRLLTTAIRLPGYNDAKHRMRTITIFFKLLYSRNEEVAQACNAGLKIVLGVQQKLPKDLLQTGLRPILMNVQDPRKLSVEGLEGLRTLLQLLTNYFKVEIGSRLLDHMKVIADPPSLQRISFSLIEQDATVRKCTTILSVFHLLPSQAIQFLGALVDRVLWLEKNLRRSRCSPFRDPLIRYLNEYSAEAWAYFAANLQDEAKGRFFAQILYEEQSAPLRAKVIEGEIFAQVLRSTSDLAESTRTSVNAIHVAHALSQHTDSRNWLVENEPARLALFDAAKTVENRRRSNKIPAELRTAVEQVYDQSILVFVTYLQCAPNDLDFLLSLMLACVDEHLRTSPALFSYLYSSVIRSEDVNYQRQIIMRCIDIYSNKTMSAKHKEFVIHNLLIPILASDVQRNWQHLIVDEQTGTTLMDRNMMETISNKLWKEQSTADIYDDPNNERTDFSRMELIQLSSFLLKYHSALLAEFKKEVIKFGWLYIRLDDAINKYGSYCLIAYFIAQYETPAKIVVQIYGKLLGASQTEGRHLVMQALEIMEPVLVKRINDQHPKMPTWARVPRKILSEETSNGQQLVCIYHFVVKHPDLFYIARESFAAVIIPTLNKVCTLPNPTPEQKPLALSLFATLWEWERSGAEEAQQIDTDQEVLPPKRAFLATYTHRLLLIKFMVQFIASMSEQFAIASPVTGEEEQPAAKTVTKALGLLFNFLSPGYWDDLDIDHMYPKVTEQILLSEQKTNTDGRPEPLWPTRIVNTLQIVRVFVNAKPDQWVVDRLPQLQKILAKHLKNEKSDVQGSLFASTKDTQGFPDLKGIIQRCLEAIPILKNDEELPDADESPSDAFLTFLSNLAGDQISAGNYVSSINIMWAMTQRKADDVDVHIPALLKAMQTKLAKDHLAAQMPTQSGAASGSVIVQPDPQDMDMTTVLIIKVIEMLSARISVLGEQRRPYLSVLASLVERSSNKSLCRRILTMVDGWIFHSTEPVPTLKEKTAVLQKMLVFEFRPDPTLYNEFLDLIIRIYEGPKTLRSELAVRMEHAFLVGLRSQDISMRTRFMKIIDRSLSRTLTNRFYKLIAEQQWDILADSYWLAQVIHLLFGAIDMNSTARLHPEDFRTPPLSEYFKGYADNGRVAEVMLDDDFETLMAQQKRFVQSLLDVSVRDLLEPLVNLQHTDNDLAHDVWIALFPMCWATLSKEDRDEVESGLIRLLTKEFHNRQSDRRPNCVATLLEGIARAKPTIRFPPHVMKFQAKNFDAWYTAATYIERLAMTPIVDTPAVRESNLDALVELYASLQENDLFYGTWRRRCQFVETNAALSHEQNGAWETAQHMYEQAQIKARTGSLSFSQGEYMLWEDHWVYCAEKMQQWEILGEFAKHESLNDLFLEATWRNYDAWTGTDNHQQLDTIIKAVSDAPTPRRLFFSAFMSLLKLHAKTETQQDFNRACDENIQLSIRQWHKLPKDITQAHITLLQNFQSIVELHDASVMCNSLTQTNASNLAEKSGELKLMLGTWRDRLPNFWDDINAWQDLVTWRQHIFHIINSVYLTLLPPNQNNSANQSYAYRGYHETAWIINRFAHVARKHQMPDICISQLSRIYTLPNIEIQEAFLKLREQAKCHYQSRSELTSGLDVINNTNLNYFGQQQKAEFYTLKGMFLAKLNHKDEASDAFGTALFFDIKLPKAWAEWGRYNDLLFKEDPQDIDKASSAISCYLEAAGQYKSAKSRKILSRILWLLSLDNASGTLAKAWAQFKGETPVWYWITFVPQLLNNLSRTVNEANIAREVLGKLSKTYPQALYFQLRTTREDMMTIKKAESNKAAKEEKARLAQAAAADKNKEPEPEPEPETEQAKAKDSEQDKDKEIDKDKDTEMEMEPVNDKGHEMDAENDKDKDKGAGSDENMDKEVEAYKEKDKEAETDKEKDKEEEKSKDPATSTPRPGSSTDVAKSEPTNADTPSKQIATTTDDAPQSQVKAEEQQHIDDPQPDEQIDTKPKKPWDHTEELITALRTAFPLLFVSMELMVDQIQKFTKHQHDEDAFRLTVALLNDALSYIGRYSQTYAQGVSLPASTEANITRFAETLQPEKLRRAFEADFVNKKPTMLEYVTKLRRWRDRFEEMLDRRPQTFHLEQVTHLQEFRYMKFDEVEVPGQYLQHRDKNQDFIRIERFIPDVDLVRSVNVCFHRLKIRGHDGSIHAFAIQHPAPRNSRREERVQQLFRSFNDTLEKKKESRRRNLHFHLPVMISLSPTVRMVEDDASYISLQGIYEDHVRRNGGNKDEPILFAIEKVKGMNPQKPDFAAVKLETFIAIQEKFVSPTIASDFFCSIYPTFDALWLFRKQFSSQLAALTFLTFTMHMTTRYPAKMNISRATGNIWGQELVPTMAQAKPIFSQPEPVPFRLTPNLQMLMGPIHTEGIFVCALQAIARSLTDVSSSTGSAAPTPNPNNGSNGATTDGTNGVGSSTKPTTSSSETTQLVDLEGQLSIFIRDEMSFWYTQMHRQNVKDGELSVNVQRNADSIVNKAVAIADGPRAGNLPASQSVLDLVARATEPRNLCMTDPLWMPWL